MTVAIALRTSLVALALLASTTMAGAQGKLGEVTVTTDEGADIYVDGQPMGTAPLPFPLAIPPGEHWIEARLRGRSARVKLDVVGGVRSAAALSFASVDSPAPAPVAAPAPAPAPSPAEAPVPPPAAEAAPPPAAPPPAESEPLAAEVDTGGGREPFIGWGKREKLAWVGGGVALLGVATGVTFSILATGNAGVANDHGDKIRAQKEADGLSGPVCSDPPATYTTACSKFVDARDLASTQQTIGIIGFIVAGVAAGGTVAYYFVDAKREPPAATFVPIATPTAGGFSVVGSF